MREIKTTLKNLRPFMLQTRKNQVLNEEKSNYEVLSLALNKELVFLT